MSSVDIGTTEVRLGERDYTIREAGALRAKPWKQRLLDEIAPLLERMNGASELKFDSPADLFALLPLAKDLLVDSAITLLELLFAYSPELEADREYIEAHATDRQILAAFQEVVKLADFLGLTSQLTRRLGRATIIT